MTRASLRKFLLVMNAVYVLLLGYSIIPALFSVMLGDGGSSVRIYIQIYSLMTLPFVLLFSLTVPWIFYGLKMQKTALVLLFLPLVNGVLILFYLVLPGWLA